jgi:hypothetical protein
MHSAGAAMGFELYDSYVRKASSRQDGQAQKAVNQRQLASTREGWICRSGCAANPGGAPQI